VNDIGFDQTATSPRNVSFSDFLSNPIPESNQLVEARLSLQEKSQYLVDQMKMEPFANPTVQSPFVFFHQRKGGGSSLRGDILKHARVLNVSKIFLPCFGTPCIPYSLPPLEKQAIYASHFNYGTLLHVMRENRRGNVTKQVNSTLSNWHSHQNPCIGRR
jgi:hypothetical protein